MNTVTRNTLHVPGASLYYETRGSGPVLLLISGGPADADVFTGFAEVLSDRYTVATYDWRGSSRSPLDGPDEDQSIELEAEDAHSLLGALTRELAYVFGNSSGAMVGLALVSKHPNQVRTLVAHEPPLIQLLPERAEHHATARQVYSTYAKDGVGAGMIAFLKTVGVDPPPQPPAGQTPEMAEAMARMSRNAGFFLAHRYLQIAEYTPDPQLLRALPGKIVIAAGDDSAGQVAHRCAEALADQLGTPVRQFPGDHGGFMSHPREFADVLNSVFSSAQLSSAAR